MTSLTLEIDHPSLKLVNKRDIKTDRWSLSITSVGERPHISTERQEATVRDIQAVGGLEALKVLAVL